jgi:DNA-binding CsgD family transcriptional regulator
MRNFFARFAYAFEVIFRPSRYVRLDAETYRAIAQLLEEYKQNRWEDDLQYPGGDYDVVNLVEDIISFGLRYRWTAINNMKVWEQLTPRQKEVAAYVCLGYSNEQISRKLVIALSTVKTHIRSVLVKFGLSGKLELKGVLKDWDFAQWDTGWD